MESGFRGAVAARRNGRGTEKEQKKKVHFGEEEQSGGDANAENEKDAMDGLEEVSEDRQRKRKSRR